MASRRSLAGLLVLMVGVATAIACGDTEPPDVPTYGPPNGIEGKSPNCPSGVSCNAGSSGGGSSGGGSSGSSSGATTGQDGGGPPAPLYYCDQHGGTIVDAGTCSVSWSTTIWPAMQGAWGCASASCHGSGLAPSMVGTASEVYAGLANYNMVPGTSSPYFNPCSTSPAQSAFVCSTSSANTCGVLMPVGITIPANGLTEIATWVGCGAPEN